MNKEEILNLSREEQRKLLYTTSSELLDMLSYSSYADVKQDVARHTYVSSDTLRRMYFDDNLAYKFLIPANPNTPEDVLLQNKAERFYLLKPHLQLAH